MPALEGRKEMILLAVVEDYIKNAEPVSSQRIIENFGLKVSSATVRNELLALDKSGHLFQPHISAGRIPTDKGYRYYVDSLKTDQGEKGDIEEAGLMNKLTDLGGEMDSLVAEASCILSHLTKLVSFVNAPSVIESRLKHLDLIPIGKDSLLLVIITNTGQVFKKAVGIDFEATGEAIESAERFLNERLHNSTFKEMAMVGQSLIELPVETRKIADLVITNILNILLSREKGFFIEGATNILLQPEFKNTGLVRDILDGLKDGQLISDLMADEAAVGQTVVRIGAENSKDQMKGCSVVFCSYGFDKVRLGVIGIVGPVRLDYIRSIRAVSTITRRLNSFSNLLRPKKGE